LPLDGGVKCRGVNRPRREAKRVKEEKKMNRLREKMTATLLIAIFMISTCAILPTFAVTEEEIEDAIELGIDWLASQQNIDGSWGWNSEAIGTTGLVLIKLQDLAYELDFDSPFDPDYPYSDNVIDGWEYLFSVDGDGNPLKATSVTLSTQTAGDPDTNNNGIGIRFGTVDYRMTYSTGICLMAIESSGTPGRSCGIDFDGDTNIDSFFEVAQDAADWLAYGQVDSGMFRGGWYYDAVDNGAGQSDNSNGGYAVLGLAAAEGMGCIVPDWVKTELEVYIDFIQNDQGPGDDNGEFLPDGGCGYYTPDWWVNSLKRIPIYLVLS